MTPPRPSPSCSPRRRDHLATTDVMGTVRLFEHKDEPLDEARERFGVVPLRPGL